MKWILFILLSGFVVKGISQAEILDGDSIAPGAGYMELTGGHYFVSDSLAFRTIPTLVAANNLLYGGKFFYFGLAGVELLFAKDGRFLDAHEGMRLSASPFDKYLYFNVDVNFSLGMVGWNNFSGILKPGINIHLPIYWKRRGNRATRLSLVAGAGVYYRYSYKLLGYLGNDEYYQDRQGYFLNVGVALSGNNK